MVELAAVDTRPMRLLLLLMMKMLRNDMRMCMMMRRRRSSRRSTPILIGTAMIGLLHCSCSFSIARMTMMRRHGYCYSQMLMPCSRPT